MDFDISTESAQIMQSMRDVMYPVARFEEPTGEPCRDPDCRCNGNGMVYRLIVVESENN
jgi:hypothetical protein